MYVVSFIVKVQAIISLMRLLSADPAKLYVIICCILFHRTLFSVIIMFQAMMNDNYQCCANNIRIAGFPHRSAMISLLQLSSSSTGLSLENSNLIETSVQTRLNRSYFVFFSLYIFDVRDKMR